LATSKQKVTLASENPAARRERLDETGAGKDAQKAAKPKAPKPALRPGDIGAPEQTAATRKIKMLGARISELEDALVRSELENSAQALGGRIRRLEKDVATYREARTAAEFIVTDLRAALDHSALAIEQLRASPAFRLGSLLMGAGQSFREFLRLPVSLIGWARDSRRHLAEKEAQLIPTGSATEYTAAVERALEVAEKQGFQEAERWTIDQRFRAQVVARVLTELAGVARRTDPREAVRLAEAALEADPNEGRVKRLAFLMGESGSVTLAAQLLRAAIEKGATLNGTEEARAQDVFALAELAAVGPALVPKQKIILAVGAANRRVLILAPQAFPFHWSSASIRTHAMAESLARANILVDVATFPGYPNIGRREPVDYPPTRNIDGVDYHLLPATQATPGFDHDYVKQTAIMIASMIKRLGTSTVIAPADLLHAYPAAVASQLASVSLVLDCSSVSPDEAHCHTERSQILSRVESRLFQYAKTAVVRTPAIAARLHEAAPGTILCFAPDSTPRAAVGKPMEPRPDNGEFVFGYVGDNAPDVDIECLGVLLQTLVDAQVNARLVIYSVGARIQAIRDQLELARLGQRVTIIEKSPPGRRSEVAYNAFDVVVAPFRLAEDVIKSPFQILSALRSHKCVVAIGAEAYEEMFGAALIHAGDLEAAARTLLALAADDGLRRDQEAAARSWDEAHPSNSLLVQAIEAI
jgi:glycosyltransferase involved in cell wall biosynthesis